jgi:hypothetical protein
MLWLAATFGPDKMKAEINLLPTTQPTLLEA